VVEVRDAFAGEFEVLGLVFADGDVGCSAVVSLALLYTSPFSCLGVGNIPMNQDIRRL